jgi:hypothetical protein
MTDRDFTQPSPHEREVLEERGEHTDENATDLTGRTAGEVGTTPYEAEVEAERRGTSADEVADEAREDAEVPLDSGYQPRTG